MRIEERLRGHDHAVDAVAALHGLFVDERLLQRVGLVHAAEPFERGDRAALDGGDRQHARTHGRAVQMDRARAALRKAATELRSVQSQLVTQHVQQHRVGFGLHRMLLAVYLEVDGRGHDTLPK
jgi:hypothetical protein